MNTLEVYLLEVQSYIYNRQRFLWYTLVSGLLNPFTDSLTYNRMISAQTAALGISEAVSHRRLLP